MRMEEILKTENPNEAMKKIYKEVTENNLSIQEMEEMVQEYSKAHNVTADEMAFYPTGERVIE